MKAFILTDKDGQIRDRDMLDLYDGFLYHNIKTQFYTQDQMFLNKDLITKDDLVLGHINMCRAALKHLDVKEPLSIDYPSQLDFYLGRSVKRMESYRFKNLLLENEQVGLGNTYFVKPVKNKIFTGFTCSTLQEYQSKTHGSGSAEWVYVSSFVNFEDEYRVYVYNTDVVEVHQYYAKHWKTKVPVDMDTVQFMVGKLKEAKMPRFYSIDVGVDNRGRTLLVECNDGYALGNYGLAPCDYAKMSMERWQEIVLNKQFPTPADECPF